MNLQALLQGFRPGCEQEEADLALIRRCIETFPDVLTRQNALCHMTASAWLVDPSCTRVCMAYHNLYKSWAWVGGHADGEANLLSVALREAQEETGLNCVYPLRTEPLSIEVLPVEPHWKRGRFVSGHLHLNCTYLLCADDAQPLTVKPDENSAVGWFSPEKAVESSTEEMMRSIYAKLNDRLRAFAEERGQRL